MFLIMRFCLCRFASQLSSNGHTFVCHPMELRGAGGTKTSQITNCVLLPLDAASMNAARHHVFVPVASCTAVRETANEISGVEFFEAFHILRQVRSLDANEATTLSEPHFAAPAFQECENADERQDFTSQHNRTHVWIGLRSAVPAFVEP